MRKPSTSPGSAFLRRRDQLCSDGWTDRALASAVSSGALVRPRRGIYLPADVGGDVIDACRHGGRLACVSALAQRGVFVLDGGVLHVHVARNAARRRSSPRPIRTHWGRLHRQPHPDDTSVEVFDALLQAVRCLPPRASIATLDSALHLGVISSDDLDELFRLLPRRYRVVRKLLDARSESGPESLVRLILRSLGARFDVQVRIQDVGRVDFVVDGWLIIECDSFAHHSNWEAQRRDRRRDQAAAKRGYATYRPIAEDIMWHADEVRDAIAGLLGAHRRCRSTSQEKPASARRGAAQSDRFS